METKEIIEFLEEKNIKVKLANATELDIKAPKGVVTKEIITMLKKHKDDLIAHFSIFDTNNDIIKKVIHEDKGYPLSYSQKKMWILSQIEDRSLAYTLSDVLFIPNNIHKDLLEKAIIATIERHETLRTIFKKDAKGEPQQWIQPIERINYTLNYTDLSTVSDTETFIDKYVKKDMDIAFDLSKDILIRTHLFQVSPTQFAFYYILHHVITDGVSMDIIIRDVLEYYRAFVENKNVSLPELRIQYKDYVVWQLQKMESPEFKSHEAFWKKQLSGKLPTLDLPNQKSRPRILTYNGRTLGTYISLEDTLALKKFCLAHGGTIFIGALVIWKILFYKYTKNKDIIIGTPIAGREHADLEDLIGIFMNLLPLRSVLNENANFIDTFKQIKDISFESSKHQAFPIDKLFEDMNIQYDPSRNPLYDVMLSFHNTSENLASNFHPSKNELDDVFIEDDENSKLDMLINTGEIGEYLYFNINYNTDIYDEVLIRQVMKNYKLILKELLNNPSTQIKNLDLDSEVKNSIREKNKTKFKMKIK
ncbi:hypothetical protein EZY14_017790 [Kordia sp. TARA_039_SRF]|nr:hypothetical protein EZY14_017790 [Kordia sp. TARA_039_SRF]